MGFYGVLLNQELSLFHESNECKVNYPKVLKGPINFSRTEVMVYLKESLTARLI